MKILMIGDVVGGPGRSILKRELPRLRKELDLGAVIVNGENSAAGSGITAALAKEIFESGADAITLGDHVWGQKDFAAELPSLDRVVRPANYPPECPGKGWTRIDMPTFSFAVLNIQGRVFMQPIDCPFKAADKALSEIPRDIPVFVDFHAEATSEKITMAHYLDGRVAALVGTHTHVQTADESILGGHTAYITDVGMVGPELSCLGVDTESAVNRLRFRMPVKFQEATGDCFLCGTIVEFNEKDGKSHKINRIIVR